jgi:hypothetical protein
VAQQANPTELTENSAADQRRTLGGEEIPTSATPVDAAPDQVARDWQPSERYEDKYVPIVSLLEGTRLGVARVNGPRSRVALTQAVVQFSIGFGDFLDIDIHVPVSTREPGPPISRVQGVGLTGLGDVKL